MQGRRLSRRDLLGLGCSVGAGALAGCAGVVRQTPHCDFVRSRVGERVGRAALHHDSGRDMRRACERVVPLISDMRWLKRGDSVFVKVSCNSPNRHPAVTSPGAVEALVAFLRHRGAGQIYVGDQAGVEYVRLTCKGRHSSTRAMMERNGLLAAIERCGATPHFFDDHGWDAGYFRARLDFRNHWRGALWLPTILQRVDHIVYLPRLGTHALAGYTCGLKNAVGWLRDDSRGYLHGQADTFFEKIAEINHAPAIRDKLRFTLTLGTHALLNVGPDFGGEYDFGGQLALAAENLVDHDHLASALLPWLDRHDTSFYDIYAPYPDHADHWNRGLVKRTWGEQALKRYRALVPYKMGGELARDICASHLALLQGYRPRKIEVVGGRQLTSEGLRAYLDRFGGGIFSLS